MKEFYGNEEKKCERFVDQTVTLDHNRIEKRRLGTKIRLGRDFLYDLLNCTIFYEIKHIAIFECLNFI